MTIAAQKSDSAVLAELALKMWRDHTFEDLRDEFDLLADDLDSVCFIKYVGEKCEKWAKEKGCSEFASDCELENDESLKFHIAMGFEEANRIICFKKDI